MFGARGTDRQSAEEYLRKQLINTTDLILETREDQGKDIPGEMGRSHGRWGCVIYDEEDLFFIIQKSMNLLFFLLYSVTTKLPPKYLLTCPLFSTLLVTNLVYDTIVLSRGASSICFISFPVPWGCLGFSP